MKKHISILFACALFLNSHAPPPQIELLDAAELQIALHKLNVLGSVLYIEAHPDDENTSALAYFSKGRKYRTAYLSLTRGDGGQNLIGPEKGAEIGIIRTQELMAARRNDGAEQFFTRAIDFGYSKTPEETLSLWGKEAILADIVWVIRSFRPDVIIARSLGEGYSGHGHHAASGKLTQEAFRAAADSNRFPEQLQHVQTWQAQRLLWNRWRGGQPEMSNVLTINTGEYNPLLGKSYSEIGAESRSMHKSQGFGAAGRRGARYDNYQLIEGTPATTDLFDGIDTTWQRVPGGREVGLMLDKIIDTFDPQYPSKSLQSLLAVHAKLTELDETYWVKIKKEELLRVIQSCAGLWIEAVSPDFAAAPGDEIKIQTTIINRSDHPFRIQEIDFNGLAPASDFDILLKNNGPQSFENSIRIPKDFPISQPYWLIFPPEKALFSVREQNLIGWAENPPSIRVNIKLSADNSLLEYSVPLLFRWTDRVDGECYRPFEIRPRVTVQIEDKVKIFTKDDPKEIRVKLKSHSPNIAGTVRLTGAVQWRVTPKSIPFVLSHKYEETKVTFKVTPPKNLDESILAAEAEISGEKFDRDLVEISHSHIKRQVYFPESRLKVIKMDVKHTGAKLGYIMGSGDEIVDALVNLGYEVTLLNDDMLERADLVQFDAIIAGIRAYNTRESLKDIYPRLLQYVKDGGTFIVQYNVSRGLQTETIGPYPFTIGRDRVSEENAPVAFLNPKHRLLNFPNKITHKDFEGWIQERGLYFASGWDERYELILTSHDTHESEKKGGLLYTRFGKGVFIYTGYSWFRQLPAGVPGAYRLFANLISSGEADGR
ncbi:MAG: PIG-L family deacetylase [Candidatus Aminicenantes bacterium]|nr:PIG-L family deacetylase [Candidatus Aminicenantes bacterium]MDH5384781.1 PIG-L family deacetylase [Candidatus Aminicenantes bacterium]MDH5742119.1 PIG-L family deacetylase [Candidatus Aminicenantes bacterium]